MKHPLYFISDIHLRLTISEIEKEKRRHLKNFINHVQEKNGSLFIVGDLFDFWFEYNYVIPKAYFDVLATLHEAKKNGLDIYYIPGNHDFWVKDFASETLFTQIYPDGFTLECQGKKFFITHGDGLLSRDRGYRIFKKIITSRFFIFLFHWVHPDLGYKFAHWFSRRSRHYEHPEEYNIAVISELTEYANNHFQDGIDYFITGHYHQTKEVDTDNGKLIVLGDWISYRSFGYFDGEELSLNYWR